jgi:simple sugar transport system permease protein
VVAEGRPQPLGFVRGRFSFGRLAIGLAVPAIAIAVGLALGAVIVVVAGESPLDAYAALVHGALGTPSNVAATLIRSTPIAITGLGVAIAFKGGVFNLGGEGQMIAGALVGAVTANALPALPAPLGILVAIAAGCVAGALWAFGPALLEVRLGVPMLITTLLLNYVAALLAAWVVTYPLRDLAAGGLAQTAMVPDVTWLPALGATRVNAGVLLIAVLPFVAAWALRRTVAGYELRMVGANREFAEYGGVDAGRAIVGATLVSGALCGLAGVVLVLGVNHRYVDGLVTSAGFAWSGFIAAVLALASPVLTVVAGLFLGALQVGGLGMTRATSVPLQLVDVVQASIILVVAVRAGIQAALLRRTVGRGGPGGRGTGG